VVFKSPFEKFSAENSIKLQASVSDLQEVVGGIAAMGAVTAEKIDLIAKNSVLQVGWLRQIHKVLVKGSATPKEKAEAAKPTKGEPVGASILGGTEKKSKGLFKGIKEAAMALVLIAGALVIFIGAMALAGLLISPAMIPAILTVTISIAIVTLAFAHILKVMAENKVSGKDILMAALAVAIMAPVIVFTALIFLMLPDQYKAPDPMWTLLAGFTILAFSVSVALLLKGGGQALGKNKSLAFTLPILIAGLALAIVAAAYIFQLLPDTYNAPPLEWSFHVGMALLAFSFPIMILSLMKWSFKQIVILPILIVALAGALLGAAWILSYAPDNWVSPPLEWSLGVGVALLMFGVVTALLGKIVQMTGGPVNFLIGALALIVLAGVILIVAHILALLPKSLFKKDGILYNVADTMEYFGFKMVNVFVYLVKELMPYVEEFITFLANLFVDIFPKIVEPLNNFIDALAVSFGKLLDHVVPLITAAFDGIAKVLSAASEIIVPIINAIKDVILGALDFIIKGFQEFRGFINDLAAIGAGNILKIGGALFSLAAGLAAVMAVFAGGAIAQGIGKAVEGLGNLVGGIASGIGNFFSGEEAPKASKEAKMDPMQFISFIASNVNALESAATALEKIAKSMAQIIMLKPTEGIMKFMDKFITYAKTISGGGLFGGPVDAIIKANNSFVSLFKQIQRTDDMKLMKVNDILENTGNLMRLDKGSAIEETMEAVSAFIEKAVSAIASNSEAIKDVSKGTEVSQSELKQMIEQMKLAVDRMGSQNIGADIKAALASATLGVRVTNFPNIYPNR
jgi:hypothetical protein